MTAPVKFWTGVGWSDNTRVWNGTQWLSDHVSYIAPSSGNVLQIQAVPQVQLAGFVAHTTTLAVSVTPEFSLVGSVASAELSSTVSIVATPTITLSAMSEKQSSVAVSSAPEVQVVGRAGKSSAVDLSVTPTIDLSASMAHASQLSVSATPTITLTPAVGHTSSLSISPTPSITMTDTLTGGGGGGAAPAFDAVGSVWNQFTTSAQTVSQTTASAGEYVIGLLVPDRSLSLTEIATYAGTNMTILTAKNNPADTSGGLYICGLNGAPAGKSALYFPYTAVDYTLATSIAYSGVSSVTVSRVRTSWTDGGSPSSGPITVPAGYTAVQVVGYGSYLTKPELTYVSGGTSRISGIASAGGDTALIVSDSQTDTNFQVTATGLWVSVDLLLKGT